jgi:hypothetical protein
MFRQRAGIRSIVPRQAHVAQELIGKEFGIRLGIYTEDAESAEDTEKKE